MLEASGPGISLISLVSSLIAFVPKSSGGCVVTKVLAAASWGLLLLLACSGSAPSPVPQVATTIPSGPSLLFSAALSDDRKTLFSEDLEYLKTLDLPDSATELRAMMKLPDGKAASLVTWLDDRVRIILDEKTDLQGSLKAKTEPFTYDEPDTLPEIESPIAYPDHKPKTKPGPALRNKAAVLLIAGGRRTFGVNETRLLHRLFRRFCVFCGRFGFAGRLRTRCLRLHEAGLRHFVFRFQILS